MDLEDIDSWYEDRKQTIMEEYLAQLEQGKDRKKAEEKYEKKMQETIKKYYSVMNEKTDTKKKSRWEKMIGDLKAKITLIGK